MSGQARTINKIAIPIVSDVSGFKKGLKGAQADAEKFSKDTHKSFSATGTGLSDSIGKVHSKLKDLGNTNLGMVTKGLAGLAAAAIASAAAIATIGFKHINDLGKDALSLGVSAEALSRLRGVARATGTDFGDLSEFMKGLTSDINASIGKTTEASLAFEKLGTSAEALAKMTPDEQIKALNKGFANLPNDAERSRVAMLLAGQTGVKVFRMLAVGTREFKDAFDNAPIVTDEDVSEIRKLQIAIDKIAASVQHLADLFTTKVAPAIVSVTSLLEAFAKKFYVAVPAAPQKVAAALPKGPTANPLPSVGGGIAAANAQAQKQAEATKAQAEAARLQQLYDKQAQQIAGSKPSYVPSTNGGAMRLAPRQQRMMDAHTETGQALGQAQRDAKRLADESKGQSTAMQDAMRMNVEVLKQFGELKGEYRQTMEGAGKDEIHRRVDQIKGLSADQRKQLIREGYQSREASKSSALRDELQESTKLPQQKLAEDLARINKMVLLGAENGGLTRAQGIRAAAQKTQESGIASAQPQFAGALDARSIEGRSYLLSQMNRTEDPVAIARQGLALTGQGNSFLARIANAVANQREQVAVLN